jgi:hypothetical protein
VQRTTDLAGELIERGAHRPHQVGHQRRALCGAAFREEELKAVEIEFETIDQSRLRAKHLLHRGESKLPDLGVGVVEQVTVGGLEGERRGLDRERVTVLQPELARHGMVVRFDHEVGVVHPQARNEAQAQGPGCFPGGPDRVRALSEADAGVLHAFGHQGAWLLVRGHPPADAARHLGVVVEDVAPHADAVNQGFHRCIRQGLQIGAEQGLGSGAVGHDEGQVGVVVENEAEVRTFPRRRRQ